MARPNKLMYEEKQAIVNDFYLLECEGQPERLDGRGVFTALAAFANRKGYPNAKFYDFSRDEKLCHYIESLCASQKQEQQTNTTAYQSFDIDFFFRHDILHETKRKRLNEYDAYVRKQLSTAENRKALFVSIQKENNALKEESNKVLLENQQLSERNKLLIEQNARYEKYIRENVIPDKAEEIFNKAKNPADIANLSISDSKSPKNASKYYRESLTSHLSLLK